ncbi:MAG: HD domain-containing protein, partial [Balneolaceae bacterium]
MISNIPDRDKSIQLLKKYIDTENLQQHCLMVADAMEAYAIDLDKDQKEVEKWWTAGLLHDLDWEKYPDEHPNQAVNVILPPLGYPTDVIMAIKAHAPERTGKEPENEIERYLFACDELSGFMNAVSLMRPNGFSDMKVKSVTKKLKDKRFAANVPREDIHKGAKLIEKQLSDHILFL